MLTPVSCTCTTGRSSSWMIVGTHKCAQPSVSCVRKGACIRVRCVSECLDKTSLFVCACVHAQAFSYVISLRKGWYLQAFHIRPHKITHSHWSDARTSVSLTCSQDCWFFSNHVPLKSQVPGDCIWLGCSIWRGYFVQWNEKRPNAIHRQTVCSCADKVCVEIYVCIYIHIHIYIYVYVSVCMCMCVCMDSVVVVKWELYITCGPDKSTHIWYAYARTTCACACNQRHVRVLVINDMCVCL
jgi:hypothetical protein